MILAGVSIPPAGRPGAKCFGPFPLPLRSSGKIARFGLFTLAFELSQESGRQLSNGG